MALFPPASGLGFPSRFIARTFFPSFFEVLLSHGPFPPRFCAGFPHCMYIFLFRIFYGLLWCSLDRLEFFTFHGTASQSSVPLWIKEEAYYRKYIEMNEQDVCRAV